MGSSKIGRAHSRKGIPSKEVEEILPEAPTSGQMDDGSEDSAETPEAVRMHPNRDSGDTPATAGDFRKQTADEIGERYPHEMAAQEELPELPTKEVLGELAAYQGKYCISIFLNTHKAGWEVNEKVDAISLKVMLQNLRDVLRNRQMPDDEIAGLLQPAYALVADSSFWAAQSEGLALYISEGYFRFLKMRVSPVDEAVCASHFLVAPLMEALSPSAYFYLLVLSKHQCRLFRVDRFRMQFIPVEGMPEGIKAVKRWSEKDASTFRTGKGSGANYHGIGGGNPDEKTSLAVYFEFIDDLLFRELLNKENVPLVLAGVSYLIPIYQSVCDYAYVWEEALTGSYKEGEMPALHEKARELMAPYFDSAKLHALNLFTEQFATDQTSSRADAVIPAARYGRIDSLFIEKGAHLWGHFDPETEKLTFHNEQRADSVEMLDQAAAASLLQGGEVFVLEREEMPTQSRIAAVFRY